ncbi:hypothetical protein AAMO2058_001459900 [Amorphochlora amoebiformis]
MLTSLLPRPLEASGDSRDLQRLSRPLETLEASRDSRDLSSHSKPLSPLPPLSRPAGTSPIPETSRSLHVRFIWQKRATRGLVSLTLCVEPLNHLFTSSFGHAQMFDRSCAKGLGLHTRIDGGTEAREK